MKKIECPKFKFWIQRNPRSIKIDERYGSEDEVKKLPARYKRVITVLDTDAVRADVEELEALLCKKSAWMESRERQGQPLRSVERLTPVEIHEFTLEDEARVDELVLMVNDIAWYKPDSYHMRIK